MKFYCNTYNVLSDSTEQLVCIYPDGDTRKKREIGGLCSKGSKNIFRFWNIIRYSLTIILLDVQNRNVVAKIN